MSKNTYKCVGCQQDVATVGSLMHIEPPPPVISSIRVCIPCTHRMMQSVGFRKAAESRVMEYAQEEFMAYIADELGETVSESQARSLNICDKDMPPDICALFDALFRLPKGSHLKASRQLKPTPSGDN